MQAIQQRKRFKVAYLLKRANVAEGVEQESEIAFAIKGGMAYDQWNPTTFFNQVILEQKKPLLFRAANEKVGLDESRFFFWLYPYADNGSQSLTFTITLDNGGTVVYVLPGTVFCGKWGICCAPVGFMQAGLHHQVPPGSTAVSYSVKVTAGLTEIVASYSFDLDYRNFYKTHQLLYRNSAGGIETLRLRGQVDYAADYDMQQAQRTVPPSYFQNLILQAQAVQSSSEIPKFSGDTGFISEEAAQKLRDFALSTQRFELAEGKLLPILFSSKSLKFYSNKESLISVQLDWQQAYSNNYFTPRKLLAPNNACPAMETFIVKQVSKNMLQFIYALAIPYDRCEIGININGVISTHYFTGNTGVVRQSINNPSNGENIPIIITARTICDEDSIPVSKGPVSFMELEIVGNSLPVAVNDNYNLNAGHSAPVKLPGQCAG